MTSDQAVDILQRTLGLAALLSAPVLIVGLIVGLVVAIFQAATQIQESTLAFVPKILSVGVTVAVMSSWAIDKMVPFTTAIIHEMATVSPSFPGW